VGLSSEGGYTFSPSEVLHTVDLMMRAVDRKPRA